MVAFLAPSWQLDGNLANCYGTFSPAKNLFRLLYFVLICFSILAFFYQTSNNVIVLFNPLQPSVAFLYYLKTSENLKFSDVFGGYRKATRGCNRLMH